MQSLQDLRLFLFGAAMCYISAAEVIRVAGYQGSEVQIPCPYQEGYGSNYQNYLCKGGCGSADVLIETQINWPTETEVIKKGRYSVRDDTKNRVFPVTITGLQLSDAGQYWCGVSVTGKDVYAEVQLEVAPEWCCVKTVELIGTEGHPIDIQCPYPRKHKLNAKFFCKGEHRLSCDDVVTSVKTHHTDLRLSEDSDSNQFLVTITTLRAQDAGTYWCGSDKEWSAGNYTNIHLSVSSPQTTTVDTTSNEVSHSVASETSTHSVTPVTGLLIEYVKFILPAVLGAVLVATLALAIICKRKCNQRDDVYTNTSRRTKHMIHGSTCGLQLPNMPLQQMQPKESDSNVYANQDMMCTKAFQGEDDIYENTRVASQC